ncbi:MAG: hypothetical protein ACO1SX_26790 [Actinomycetota bacterium]
MSHPNAKLTRGAFRLCEHVVACLRRRVQRRLERTLVRGADLRHPDPLAAAFG